MGNDGFTINPKIYDFLKFVALVILPALAALVIGIGLALNWSGATGVAGVITVVDTCLGSILGQSARNFKDQAPNVFGDLVVKQDIDGRPVGFGLVGHRENPIFEDGGQVVLNVRREQPLQ